MNSSTISFLAGVLIAFAPVGQAQEATITVQADQVLHQVSPYLTGACIEDVNHEVYGGIYSQMIFGESLAEPAPPPPLKGSTVGGVSGMWSALQRGSAQGQCSVETTNPFVGTQSQRITFTSGAGEIGIANQGLNRWGMSFVGGSPYEGCLDVRADAP